MTKSFVRCLPMIKECFMEMSPTVTLQFVIPTDCRLCPVAKSADNILASVNEGLTGRIYIKFIYTYNLHIVNLIL